MAHARGKTVRNIVVFLAVFAAVLGLAACAPRDGAPFVDRPAEHYALTMDEMLVEVAAREPAFGGLFLDQAGVLNVHLTDTTRLDDAERAIVEVFGSAIIPEAGVAAVPADYGFQELFDWHQAHRAATLADPGVIAVSIQELTNRLKIRVDSDATRMAVAQKLADAGIPEAVVEFEIGPAFAYHQAAVDERSRPLIGGQRISSSTGSCTLGFMAVRDGVAGFVTNSHCQGVQGSFMGTTWHQELPGSGAENQVGEEAVDPDYSFGGDCPSSMLCRRSDSAFVARTTVPGLAPPTARFDAIALPGDYAGGGKTIDTFARIRQKQPHALCGQQIQKIGWRSGSTTGTVTDTCVDTKGTGNFVFFCQNLAEITTMDGDSGAPAFTWSSAGLVPGAKPRATLYGLFWGSEGGIAAFSPINFIEAELGFLRTNRFEGGANSPPAIAILSPSDNATVGAGGLAIETYEAAVADWEDGEGCCNVQWTSDIDGVMGGGKVLDHAFTTQGARQITATATDGDGATATAMITVQTSNDPPVVTILAPANNATVVQGAPVLLQGSGYDVNEPFQALDCSMLTWSSSSPADPWQPSDCTAEVAFATAGPRTVTLTGVDSGSLQDTASVAVNVVAPTPGAPPDVLILNPTVDAAFNPAAQVLLTGKVTDVEGGSPITYEWLLTPGAGTVLTGGASQISLGAGNAASGQQFTTSWTPGDHIVAQPGGKAATVTLVGTDADGTAQANVSFTVIFPPA